MESDKTGLNFRSLLDGLLNQRERDLTDYKQRNELISEIEKAMEEYDWIQLSNSTVFDKSYYKLHLKTNQT